MATCTAEAKEEDYKGMEKEGKKGNRRQEDWKVREGEQDNTSYH